MKIFLFLFILFLSTIAYAAVNITGGSSSTGNIKMSQSLSNSVFPLQFPAQF